MIEIKGLTKRFGPTVAVDGLSFTVQPGLVTGFLGSNGAGKTTTMRLILGLDRPSSGEALVNGVHYGSIRTPLRQVGALLDANDVHGGRTAAAHLLALAQSNGLARSRVPQVLEETGLAEVAGRRIRQFSLGMTQRLGIAAALLGDPGVLILDEPINGLDPEGIVWIRTFMRELARQGRTVLVSSHLMSEMALTADHLIVIGRGRLLADISTREFVAANSHGEVRVRSTDPGKLARILDGHGRRSSFADDVLQVFDATTDEIGQLAFRHGIAVLELAEESPSLEAAFMDTTRDSAQFRAGQADRTAQNRPIDVLAEST